mmetsp:Transcript_3907/g.6121  ORF Transcript_3907/g.6121 Transcript_3907/m.6121 type:complete len:219 (+) Transcript_3907:41-697(+)
MSTPANIKAAFDDFLKIVYGLLAKPDADPFREPVDWEAIGLLDYPDIVKQPMDLGTLKRKLQKNMYKSIDEAARDMRLIWTNCMTYNQDGSEYYHLADTFAKTFEEKYAELRSKHGFDSNDPDRIPSMDEKIQMSYDLFKIEPAQLGRILTVIEKSCPRAVTRDNIEGSEEALVNIDFLSPTCFHEVAAYIKSCGPADSKGKRKRSGGGGSTSKKAAK